MKRIIAFSDSEIEFIKTNYGVITRREIAKKLDRPEHQIKKMVKKLKLHSSLSFRMYTRNDNAFSNITLEACYWAGFIAADGCLYNKRELRVCLSNADKGHLEKLRNFIGYTGPLAQSKITTNLYLVVSSSQIYSDLNKNFNITPRKSLTLLPPIGLTYKQSLAYIIGYIDGDGSIGYNSYTYKNGTKYKFLRLRIIGTPMTLNWINLIFKKRAIPIQHCKSKISIISFNDRNLLIKLKGFILDNSLPVLSRKWDKVKFSTVPVISKARQAIEVITKSTGKIRKFSTIEEASKILKIDRCYIFHLIWEPINHHKYIFKKVK